jgi:hypothetical protein
LEKLQRIASTGLPDGGSLRATAWKVRVLFLSYPGLHYAIRIGLQTKLTNALISSEHCMFGFQNSGNHVRAERKNSAECFRQ